MWIYHNQLSAPGEELILRWSRAEDVYWIHKCAGFRCVELIFCPMASTEICLGWKARDERNYRAQPAMVTDPEDTKSRAPRARPEIPDGLL